MGKSKKKNKKSEFDDFFGGKQPTSSGTDGWMSGVSAMALDSEPPTAGTAAAAAMDTTDGPAATKPELGVRHGSMKVGGKRGQRTKIQKERKSIKAEKALARADMTVVRMGSKAALKQKRLGLKHMY